MSTALFRSRQQKLRRNIKGLLILPPVMSQTSVITPPTPTRSTVVLRAIYDFQSESEVELSISKGDYLRFMDKPGDGWLKVQHIERPDCGLVPAAYVDIEINDHADPITKEWLVDVTPASTPLQEIFPSSNENTNTKSYNGSIRNNRSSKFSISRSGSNNLIAEKNYTHEIESFSDEFEFFQRDHKSSIQSPTSIDFQFSNINVLQVVQSDGRFYYRIDFLRESSIRRYAMKTYQDFYNLHITLLEISIDQHLPKLPQPVRQQTKSLLLIRCNELNVYINKLSMKPFFKNCEEFKNWLDIDDDLHNTAASFTTDSDINQTLLPGLTNILNENGTFSTTAPLPRIRTSPKKNVPISNSNNYRDLNSKYSTYLQQKNKSGMVHLVLDQTLSSYSLLIDGYEEERLQNQIKMNSTTSNSDSEGDSSSVFLDHDGPSTPIVEGETTPNFVTPILEKVVEVEKSYSPTQILKQKEEEPVRTLSNIKESDYVKAKFLLKNQEDDIIVLKVARDIPNLESLKQQLSDKVYGDKKLINHYELGCDGERDSEYILNKIQTSKKISLEVIRTR